MKIKGIIFSAIVVLVGYTVAMVKEPALKRQHASEISQTLLTFQPLSLKQQAAIAKVKNIVQEIYSSDQSQQQVIDAFKKEIPNWSTLPLEIREPLLAELGRQYYMLYGKRLDTGQEWGVSIQDYLDNPVLKKKIPQIKTGRTVSLYLHNMKINNLYGLQNILNIGTVQSLYLINNQLSTIPTNGFAGLSKLTDLRLANNQLTTIQPDAFAGLTKLDYLDLGNNQLTTIQPDAFAGFTKLDYLDLGNNQLTTIQPDAFAGLTKLTGLYLGNNQLKDIQPDAFVDLTNLRTLYLANNQLITIQPDAFVGLTNLTDLRLANNQLKDIQAKAFAGLTKLRILFLGNNQLKDIQPDAFVGLTNLTGLDLTNNQLTIQTKDAIKKVFRSPDMDIFF